MKLPERSSYTLSEAAEMWETTVTSLLYLWSEDKIRCAVKLETPVYLYVGDDDDIESLLNMGADSPGPIPLDKNEPIAFENRTKRPSLAYGYHCDENDDEPLDLDEFSLDPIYFYFEAEKLLWCDNVVANSFLRDRQIVNLVNVGPWDYDGTRQKWRGPYIFGVHPSINYPVTIDQILIPTTEVRRLEDLHKKSIDASNNDVLRENSGDILHGMIAAMAVIISEDKSGKYRHGENPNCANIAERIQKHFPDRQIDTIRKQLGDSLKKGFLQKR